MAPAVVYESPCYIFCVQYIKSSYSMGGTAGQQEWHEQGLPQARTSLGMNKAPAEARASTVDAMASLTGQPPGDVNTSSAGAGPARLMQWPAGQRSAEKSQQGQACMGQQSKGQASKGRTCASRSRASRTRAEHGPEEQGPSKCQQSKGLKGREWASRARAMEACMRQQSRSQGQARASKSRNWPTCARAVRNGPA